MGHNNIYVFVFCINYDNAALILSPAAPNSRWHGANSMRHEAKLKRCEANSRQSYLGFYEKWYLTQEKQVHSLCVDSRPGDRLRLIFR